MKKSTLAMMLSVTIIGVTGCANTSEGAGNTQDTANQQSSDNSVESATTVDDGDTALADSLDPETEYVFGTATLTYAQFYEGDVSSTDSYDAVSSATSKKYELFTNADTDYVDETTNAEGYNILGVKNVNVAVPSDQVEEYEKINDTFVVSDDTPAQYKIVSVEGGAASYSATVFSVADTVTDADVELLTGTNWGDYQINIIETSTAYLRNTREDEGFAIGADVQGVIIETSSGLKVGMEHLQSIWVQPYEISFNIEADNSHNSHISSDNLPELSKLENEEIVSVTFINQNDTYVYTFDPVFVKPVYRDVTVTAAVDEEAGTLTLSQIPEGLENATLTVTFITGKGHDSVSTQLYEGSAETSVQIDTEALATAKSGDVEDARYTVVISSDNYANIEAEVAE